jgi:hypothetical protein
VDTEVTSTTKEEKVRASMTISKRSSDSEQKRETKKNPTSRATLLSLKKRDHGEPQQRKIIEKGVRLHSLKYRRDA